MFDSIRQSYEFAARGGPVMAVIGLASVICLALIVERLWSLRRSRIIPELIVREIEILAQGQKWSEALSVARTSDSTAARVAAAGLARSDEGDAAMVAAFEGAGKRESVGLERNLEFLSTLAAVGPLLGLFGTITGMIRTFMAVRAVGVGDPMKLSGGIAEALICTAGGLVVAIPALVFHRYFIQKVDRFVLELETLAEELVGYRKKG